jgi:dCTP deaminase
MELSNTAPLPVRVYANEGIAQLIFLEADQVCEVSYADKKGKYQAQKRITPARV